MKNKLFFIFTLLCLISCERINENANLKPTQVKKNQDDTITEISPSTSYGKDFENNEKIKTLSQRIRKQGDTIAYNELRYIYWYSGHVAEFLPYSLIMANDFDYPIAYFHCYKEMNLLSINNLKTDNWAKYYLLVAYEKHDKSAKYIIKDVFGKNIPNSKNYWNSLKK